MSVPISDLIQVNIAISPNAVAVDGFGPLLFMCSEFKPTRAERYPVRSYTSLASVLEDFPSGEIAKAATAWYSQKPMPKTFLVGAITSETIIPATAGYVEATSAATVSTVNTVKTGQLHFSVDGGDLVSVTGIDLSGAKDFDAIVTALNAKLVDANIKAKFSHSTGKFKLTSNTTGPKSYISNVSGDVATAIKLDPTSTPTYKAGVEEKSIATDLANISNTPYDFYYVAIDRKYRGTKNSSGIQMSVAKWCEGSNRVFGWGDSDANILVMGSNNSFAVAKNQNLMRTICVFDASENGDEYPEVSILGRAATVNFNVANSALVLAYKKGPGISTADLGSNQLAALRNVNGNAFINVGGNVMFYDGKMADGTWFDTVQGTDWLTAKIRANVFNLFYTSTTKIPWTETGVSMVNQQITLALELAVTNGLIAPGYDNEDNFYPDGYAVISTDLELMQSQKGSRIWEGSSFIAIGSGALQGAVISGTFVQ